MGYHNLKHDGKSLYLTTFYVSLDWSLQVICSREKIDELFKELPDVFVIGYDSDGINHDRTLCRKLQICRK